MVTVYTPCALKPTGVASSTSVHGPANIPLCGALCFRPLAGCAAVTESDMLGIRQQYFNNLLLLGLPVYACMRPEAGTEQSLCGAHCALSGLSPRQHSSCASVDCTHGLDFAKEVHLIDKIWVMHTCEHHSSTRALHTVLQSISARF